MQLEWMHIAWIYESLFILTLIYALRELIQEKLNGVRFKRWLIIDTGQSGYGILNKSLNEWKVMGQKRSVAFENIQRGWVFYTHDNAENLKLEQVKIDNDYSKYTAYCNTDEFNTTVNTKVFQMLLYIAEKGLLNIIIVIAALGLAASIFGAYTIYQQQGTINYIASRLSQQAGDIIVNK